MKNSLLTKFGVALLIAPLAALAQPAASSDAASAPALSDANIAAIVVAANTIDIKAGKLAEKKSDNAEVKGFGEMMVRDHEAVNKQAKDLVTKLGVTPVDNDLSKKLKSDAAKTYSSLKSKKGAEFDRAYVDNEVAYHQAVISVIDTMLIPAAQNAELKALLQQVLPAFVAHLEHAKEVQSKLK
jgi:putative membrane protein